MWQERLSGDPKKAITPQWYVARTNVLTKVGDRTSHYRIGFMDAASPRDRRSLTAALIAPDVVCGHSVPRRLFPPEEHRAYMPTLAVLNAFITDRVARPR